MKTYVAARDLQIQSRKFSSGEVLGTGDIAKGQFTPAKGLERYVGLGHVLARVADGRVIEQSGDAKPAKPKEPDDHGTVGAEGDDGAKKKAKK